MTCVAADGAGAGRAAGDRRDRGAQGRRPVRGGVADADVCVESGRGHGDDRGGRIGAAGRARGAVRGGAARGPPAAAVDRPAPRRARARHVRGGLHARRERPRLAARGRAGQAHAARCAPAGARCSASGSRAAAQRSLVRGARGGSRLRLAGRSGAQRQVATRRSRSSGADRRRGARDSGAALRSCATSASIGCRLSGGPESRATVASVRTGVLRVPSDGGPHASGSKRSEGS